MTEFNTTAPTSHLFWIGGSPCGGKSTIAQMIAKGCGLHLYSIDEELPRIMQDMTPDDAPALCLWETQTWEERWMQPVDDLLAFVFKAYAEVFNLCMKEIQTISPGQPTLIEGNPLIPDMILPYLTDKNHAIWLFAEDEDLRHYYGQREWTHQVVKECSDPDLAFNNWMERDIAFANKVRESCETHQLTYLMSDRKLSLEKKAHLVAAHLNLPCDL